jgi:hypothetical protein
MPQIATETGFMLPASVTLTNSNSIATTANVVITTGSTTLFSGNFYVNPKQTVAEPCYFNANLLPIGTYTCTVTISTPAMTAPSKQTSTGKIGVTYVDDFTGDYKVSSLDYFYFVDAYIQYNSNGIYNSAYDLSHDGKIDSSAFFLFTRNYVSYFASTS